MNSNLNKFPLFFRSFICVHVFKPREETGENTFHVWCILQIHAGSDALFLLPFCLTEKDLFELKLMTVVAHVFFKRPN